MDLHMTWAPLFAALESVGWGEWLVGTILNVVQVVVGLGILIFVHELGHFLVAKWCGVECQKFYLGFDVGGWKLLSFQWGETEYGIGALPLGGYVKMLGQGDDPTTMQEEFEKAKLKQPAAEGADGEELEESEPVHNPRSFQAQSVFRRMAIISAGVVMNAIFVFVFLLGAHLYGANAAPCEISSVRPGGPAWQAGLSPGDVVAEIGGREHPQFKHLRLEVLLRDHGPEGVPMSVLKAGAEKPVAMSIVPLKVGGKGQLGIYQPTSRVLYRKMPFYDGTPAAQASPPFKGSDEVVAVDGTKVPSFGLMWKKFCAVADRPAAVTVQRGGAQRVDVTATVAANPMRELGLDLSVGQITGVEKGSPADLAGLKAGDALTKIDGRPVADPMALPDLFFKLAGKEVKVEVQREGAKVEATVTPRPWAAWINPPQFATDALEVGALGVAFRVLNHVEGLRPELQVVTVVAPPTTGAKAGDDPKTFLKGANIVAVKVQRQAAATKSGFVEDVTVKLGDEKKPNWPFFYWVVLQRIPVDDSVEVELDNGAKLKLKVYASTTAFNPDRGFIFETLQVPTVAPSFKEAVASSWEDTLENLQTPFLALKGMLTGKTDHSDLGGPVKIFALASAVADHGFGDFLLFLASISASLAVFNFLPIPVLDGGHMCFLVWEWVVGKPASEKVQIYLTLAGLCFLLLLILFVTFQDVSGLIFRS